MPSDFSSFSKNEGTVLPESFKPNSNNFIKLGNYPKSRYRWYYKKRLKDLTYILGARCKDGVVLVGDRVVSRGSSYSYENKLTRPYRQVVMGSAGTSGLFEQFLRKLDVILSKKKIETSVDFLDEVSLQVSNVFNFNKKIMKDSEYKQPIYLEVLVGVQQDRGRPSELWHVYPSGYRELEKGAVVIGSGEPYGELFLKKLWNGKLNMFETANIGCFVIKLIECCRLDTSIGGKPQGFVIPDLPMESRLKKMKKSELRKFEIREMEAKNQFEKKMERKANELLHFIKKLKITE